MDRPKGVTLVEILVVVAIISALAAVAIPEFRNYQLRSIRTEAIVILDMVGAAQASYFAEKGEYFRKGCPTICDIGPSTIHQEFGFGPTTTKMGWQFGNYRTYGLGPLKTTGYRVSVFREMDSPADGFSDVLAIQVGATDTSSDCPSGIPYIWIDDIVNVFHSCV